MSNLLKYVEFIVESVNDGRIIYSTRLRTLLRSVSDKSKDTFNVAGYLLRLENRIDYKDTFTLIDITDKNDTISMINISRINRAISHDPDILSFIDSVSPENRVDHIISHASYGSNSIPWIDRLWKNQRTDVKIGRHVKRLIPKLSQISGTSKITDADIEVFVNLYKSSFDYEKGLKDRLEMVNGDLIKEWYSEGKYQSGGGSLNNSCMRYSKCQNYFDIYTKNPEVCNLLILKNESGKLIARSLVWKLTDGRTYMDRVYTVNDSDTNIFRDYATEKGWIYYNGGGLSKMEVQLKKEEYVKFPYMDTFYSYNKEVNILVNDEIRESDDWYILQNTDGSYSVGGGVWSEYHNEYLNEDEAVWCDNINSYVYQEDAIWLEYRQEWAGPSEEIIWSEHSQESYYRDDVVWSECMTSWLHTEDTIEIITDYDEEIDYCDPIRKDIYIEVGGKYYLRKNYVKNPLKGLNEYVFLDQKENGVKFKDQLESVVKEETGDNGDGIKARERLNILIKELMSKDNTEHIKSIENISAYKDWKNSYQLRGRENILQTIDILYYVFYWYSIPDRPSPNKYLSPSFVGSKYNELLQLIPDESSVRYKNFASVGEAISSDKARLIISGLSGVAIEFDYSVFGVEFCKLYLYLSI